MSEAMTRGWITLDGREIVSCSTIKQHRETHLATGEWYPQDESVREDMHRQGIFTRQEFVEALEECVGSPIQSALSSSNPLARAVALLDRRLGRRRLQKKTFGDDEVQIVKDFYRIRCQAEGLGEKPAVD